VKYVLVAVAVFLIAISATLAVKGLLNKDGVMRLMGRGPETEVVEDIMASETFGGSVGDKLALREKELDERAMKLDGEAERLKLEIRRFEKLREDVEEQMKDLRGELDSQDSEAAAKLKSFAEKIELMGEKEAAQLLEKLEADDVIRLLENIEPRKSGKILDEMAAGEVAGDVLESIMRGTR
jgi:flagellar motility protein MotE (MotC chaperone)